MAILEVTLMVKNLPAIVGDIRNTGLIHGPGRSPGEGNDNPLQYACLENSMDKGAWQAAKSQIRLSTQEYVCACVYYL